MEGRKDRRPTQRTSDSYHGNAALAFRRTLLIYFTPRNCYASASTGNNRHFNTGKASYYRVGKIRRFRMQTLLAEVLGCQHPQVDPEFFKRGVVRLQFPSGRVAWVSIAYACHFLNR
jgi:hypothetical protein